MSGLTHSEIHMVHRIGWLRAAVLGANDGIVSTASLVVGVVAAGSGRGAVLVAGLARSTVDSRVLRVASARISRDSLPPLPIR
jgi:VIT1/CCC1 family predicted Fe2+/Mn2+ transporter